MSNNLDALINKIGFEIVRDKKVDKNQINKMLGVLANDGVYAWWVYTKKELEWKFVKNPEEFKSYDLIVLLLLLSEFSYLFKNNMLITDENINEICKKQQEIETKKSEKDGNIKQEIDEEINKLSEAQNDLLNNFFLRLSEDLNSLFFFREILEKILIYARYHAKAMGN